MACIENTRAWDGAAPFVIGSPVSLPNTITMHVQGQRVLRNAFGKILDALDAGGSGDPYKDLTPDEADMLRELTRMGFPPLAWYLEAKGVIDPGSLPVLLPGMKRMDPGYFTDFWTQPGYAGSDPESSSSWDRICFRTKVKAVRQSDKTDARSCEDGRNGVDDAYKKQMVSGNGAEKQAATVPGTNVEMDDTEEFDGVLTKLKPNCRNLVEALRSRLPHCRVLYAQGYYKAGADDSLFAEALDIAGQADVILLTLGGKNGSGSIATMGEGVDGTDINLPAGQDAFLRAAKKLGKPMIGIHFDGRPISSDAADENLDAILECWNPAAYAAEAVADALLGRSNPSGKLPLSVARNAGQIPVYYNHPNGSMWTQGPSIGFTDYVDCPHRPRYCFGHGLSYTRFAYGELTLDKKELRPFEEVTVSMKVKNAGDRAGTEIVQLYVKDPRASMTRPQKELQGFARVDLRPGEEKTVRFALRPSQMAFLDEDMRWKIEKGEFQVQIGSSSEDIRGQESFTVTENAYLAGKTRAFYALGETE